MEGHRRGTGGAFLLFEMTLDGGKVTPLHLHPESDDTMYLLEGEVLVHLDDQEHRLGPLGVAVAPRGVPHAFLVLSDTARALCLLTPGHGEQFYRDASEPLTGGPTSSEVVDFGRVQSSAERNGGIEILGPPPFIRS